MMEVSSSVKTEEEDENELSLELSIGRKCYKNKTTTTTLPQDLPIIDLPLKRHEIQALRRQEARKKRDQKLKFKSTLSCQGGGGGGGGGIVDHEDHGIVDHEDQGDEEEEEEEAEMPPRKKEKCQSFSHNNHNSVVAQKQDKLVARDLDLKMNHESSLRGESPCPCPNLPAATQYVPFTNGFVYHPSSCSGSVVACTHGFMDKDKRIRFGNASTGGNEGSGKDKRGVVSFDTAACGSFRPYGRRNMEMNGKSDVSSGGSSPAVSDHHNSSLQGGSSSIIFPQESRNAFSAGNGPKKCDIRIWDSMGMVSNQVKIKTKANDTVNTTSSTNIQDRESMRGEELKPAALLRDPAPLSTKNPIDPALLKKETSNAVITNPSKPQTECNGASHLPQMPCVSTTGNGPNGKTITGFLYRYTKTEVCIVCVCHGTSFSPAEFVKHAGGVDVEHPLRHITIVPSDLA